MEISTEIQSYLESELDELLNENNIDFLHGMVGEYLYFFDQIVVTTKLSKTAVICSFYIM